jgi:uncharacterized protein (DUF302 family)
LADLPPKVHLQQVYNSLRVIATASRLNSGDPNGLSKPHPNQPEGRDNMNAQITKTPFTCQLITIHSKKSFAELIDLIEKTFHHYDAKTLRDLTTERDTDKLAAYIKEVGGETEFAIFFWLDQGSTQRLAGIPIESRFYLFGNATIANGLFRYSARAGLGAPVRFCVSQTDGEDARIDIDLPTSFFSQFPELDASPVPKELDERMIPLLQKIAS